MLESCHFEVGPNYSVIGPFGNLTLRAGRDLALGNGFSVGLEAALTLEIDPNLMLRPLLSGGDPWALLR